MRTVAAAAHPAAASALTATSARRKLLAAMHACLSENPDTDDRTSPRPRTSRETHGTIATLDACVLAMQA
jgi:hypothetical protein